MELAECSKLRSQPELSTTMDAAHYRLKATLAHLCSSNSTDPRHAGHADSPALWRPWMSFGGSRIQGAQQRLGVPADSAEQCNIRSKGAHGFQHPVRLYMPKSKTEEYLNHMGKKVLASFPVQATIHFYNDDTDSEEEEEDEYSMDLHNYSHNAESFAGREMGGATEGSKAHSSSVTYQSSQ